MLAIGLALIVVAAVLWHVLAEREHRRHRKYMGLAPEPSPWSSYMNECKEARIRTEVRQGISPPIKGVRR